MCQVETELCTPSPLLLLLRFRAVLFVLALGIAVPVPPDTALPLANVLAAVTALGVREDRHSPHLLMAHVVTGLQRVVDPLPLGSLVGGQYSFTAICRMFSWKIGISFCASASASSSDSAL